MSGFSRATRASVVARDRGECFICGRAWRAGVDSIHHRRPRGMGGSKGGDVNGAANGILLCGSGTTGCHGRVEGDRRRGLEMGWLVSRLSSKGPAETALWSPVRGAWVMLDNHGRVTVIGPQGGREGVEG